MAKSPTYRLHKATGQACTTIRGKTYYFGRHGTAASKRKFKELLAKYLLAPDPTTFGEDIARLSIAEGARSYAIYAKTYYGADSQEYRNIAMALRPISELMPRKLAVEFGPLEFKQIRQWWLNRDVSRQYANQQMRRITRAIKWMVSEGILPPSIHQAIKCVTPLTRGHCKAREAPTVVAIDDVTVDATLPHLSNVVAAMVRFQRLTGCRPGEVCKLKPNMVDRSNSVWEIRLENHKTAWRGKSRTIYVGPQAQAVLLPYLNRPVDAFCFNPREAVRQKLKARKESRVTPKSYGNSSGTNRVSRPSRKPGNCYSTASYGRSIKYGFRLAFPAPTDLKGEALKNWRSDHQWAPNQLRHALATSIRRTDGIEAASVILGHSSLAITQTYAEQDRRNAIQVVGRVG